MRKLLTALLVLPFLVGANGHTAVPADVATSNQSFSSSTGRIAQPSLPGQISSGLAAPTLLPDPGSVDGWRAPLRSGQSGSGILTAALHAAGARTHLHLVDHQRLSFSHSLARARTGAPITFGNPPPTSPT